MAILPPLLSEHRSGARDETATNPPWPPLQKGAGRKTGGFFQAEFFSNLGDCLPSFHNSLSSSLGLNHSCGISETSGSGSYACSYPDATVPLTACIRLAYLGFDSCYLYKYSQWYSAAQPDNPHGRKTVVIARFFRTSGRDSVASLPSFPHALSGGSIALTTGGFRTGPPIKTFGGDDSEIMGQI